jgi:hypothetical protein
MRTVGLIFAVALTATSGCSEKPSLRIEQVRSAQFTFEPLSSAVLEELVTAFQNARLLRSDVGTTHPVRIDLVLTSGDTMVIFGGGGTGFQTVALGNRQFNVQGQELEALLDRLHASYMAEPGGAANGSQPIRAETNRMSSAAGSRR